VVVDDFDIMRIAGLPAEANPELIIDPYAVLTSSILVQSFKVVARRDCKIREFDGRIENCKLFPGTSTQICR